MSILEFLKPIHIFAGAAALISGLVAMSAKKGNQRHRISGKVFFWSMTITTILGLNAGIFKPEFRIFIPIAIISFYQVASGYRILFIKRLHEGQRAGLIDWVLTCGILTTSSIFAFLGFQSLSSDIFYSIVLFSFSAIGLYCGLIDVYHYVRKPSNRFYWLFIHIFRMSHGFIAALTAFLVNNSKLFPFLPQVILLIIPISFGQPFISLVIWNYKRNKDKSGMMEGRSKLDTSIVR